MGPEWGFLINGLIQVLGIIRTNRHQERELTDRALISIYAASNETRFYLQSLQRGKERNLEKENSLSHLWVNASTCIRHFDPDLARRCMLKGEYWKNPDQWTVAEINDARIGLNDVFKAAKDILLCE